MKLVFRDNKEKYDFPVIEVGYWDKRFDGSDFFYTILDICPVEKEVLTSCADDYYDYSIGFKEFLEIADKIREILKETNETINH